MPDNTPVPLPGEPDAGPPTFSKLGLTPGLAERAKAAGWAQPTPIQAAALPAVLQGRDVLGLAPTGSGKTAAYLLPLLQRLLAVPDGLRERPRRLRAVLLAPTRELATQISKAVKALAPELKTVVAVGGLSVNPQMMDLRGGAHLVVATPGRLLDLLDHKALHLNDLRTLVLDEADRLLDLGFADEIARVLALIPTRRQTLLFSATLPETVQALALQCLTQPVRIDLQPAQGGAGSIETGGPEPLIKQRAIVVDMARRTPLLRHFLQTERWPRALVFVATQYAAEHVADKLRQSGVAAAALHGRQSNSRRAQALADLDRGAINVLVATDLAARGIDIARLEVVVNHDLPRAALDHIHRIGRTGRAGHPGLAVSFILADTPGSEAHFRLIEKRQLSRVPREVVPGFEPSSGLANAQNSSGGDPVSDPVSDPHGGVKGRRPSKKDRLRFRGP